HAVEVRTEMAVAGAGEVDPAGRFIDVVEGARFPGAAGDRALELAVFVIVIEVFPAGPFAGQQEGTVLEEGRSAGLIHPGFGGFPDRPARLAACGRGGAKTHPGLGRVVDEKKSALAARRPAGPYHQRRRLRITAQTPPSDFPAGNRGGAEFDPRVG